MREPTEPTGQIDQKERQRHEQHGNPRSGGHRRDGVHPLRRALGRGHQRPPHRCRRGVHHLGRCGHRRHRRLLAGHAGLGPVRHHPVQAPEDRIQAGDPGGELLRHRLGGLPQRLLRGGLGRLRAGHGHRGGEAEGLGLLRPDRDPQGGGRHQRRPQLACRLLVPGPGLLPQVRRRSRGDGLGAQPHRLEEPPERGGEPAGPVPEGGLAGEDRRLAAGGRPARGVRLQRGQRRRGGSPDLPGRGCPPVHRLARST